MRTVHRLIEQHAANNGDALAISDGASSCSYRELNAAANVMARRLIAAGFRRGMRAHVRMVPSVDLAVILLAILKTGGCYTVDDEPAGQRPALLIHVPDGEYRELLIGEVSLNGACGCNLPVMTRETEIAFVIEGDAGEDAIAVPHATVVAMLSCSAASCAGGVTTPWTRESGAFDLWVALMSGATALINEPAAVAA